MFYEFISHPRYLQFVYFLQCAFCFNLIEPCRPRLYCPTVIQYFRASSLRESRRPLRSYPCIFAFGHSGPDCALLSLREVEAVLRLLWWFVTCFSPPLSCHRMKANDCCDDVEAYKYSKDSERVFEPNPLSCYCSKHSFESAREAIHFGVYNSLLRYDFCEFEWRYSV